MTTPGTRAQPWLALAKKAPCRPAAPEPDTEAVLSLAAIICKVDGNHALGAHALAEAILAHPGSRWQAAAPPDRDASIEATRGDTTSAEAMEVPPELVPVRFVVENSEAIIVSALGGWAVKNDPLRLSIDGAWDVEPMPSFRTREWIIRHRFDTIRAAYEALLKAKEDQA